MARFDLTRFRTTHNSYSGNARGSLVQQLNQKIRYVEFDVHDSGYDQVGDYRLGHLKPGLEVAIGAGGPNDNPASLLLRDWFALLAGWSAANPGHAPITVALDLKDDLTDNEGGGDLGDLNATLLGAFGAKLFTREEFDAAGNWPEVDAMRNRFLCVLSGDGETRASYRWAFGLSPSIAVNESGDTVIVYRSRAGDLNAWTGGTDVLTAAITWERRTTYAFSSLNLSDPVIAINDDGWIVAAHAFQTTDSPPRSLIESRVGRLQDDGRIRWHKSDIVAEGTAPSLEIDGDAVREIHMAPDGGRQEVRGELSRQKRRMEWQNARATQNQPFVRAAALLDGHQLVCAAGPDGLITVSVDGGAAQPVRFRQVAFIEMQSDSEIPSLRDARFFAAGAKNRDEIARAREQGLVARAWGFEQGDRTGPPPPPQENMPATDTPEAQWYIDYMAGTDVAE